MSAPNVPPDFSALVRRATEGDRAAAVTVCTMVEEPIRRHLEAAPRDGRGLLALAEVRQALYALRLLDAIGAPPDRVAARETARAAALVAWSSTQRLSTAQEPDWTEAMMLARAEVAEFLRLIIETYHTAHGTDALAGLHDTLASRRAEPPSPSLGDMLGWN